MCGLLENAKSQQSHDHSVSSVAEISRTIPRRPLIIGISGLQGSGKSTWASTLVQLLREEHHLRAITVSLDDFYRTHTDLMALREANPDNKLLRVRGQPGTHDEQLAATFFKSLARSLPGEDILIPSFDKSRHNGEGDRVDREDWERVKAPIDIVVFEGWCLGFRPLSQSEIAQRQEATRKEATSSLGKDCLTKTLHNHSLEHLITINDNLGRYCRTFMGSQCFDAMIHLDTDLLENVFEWRLQQEHALWKARNCGMTDGQVIQFVQGYMPAYELYLDGLRQGFFGDFSTDERGVVEKKRHIRVLLDRNRYVVSVETV